MRACDDCGGIVSQLRQQANPVAINITGQIILRAFIRLNRLNAMQIHFQHALHQHGSMKPHPSFAIKHYPTKNSPAQKGGAGSPLHAANVVNLIYFMATVPRRARSDAPYLGFIKPHPPFPSKDFSR